jgi:hypothetical protein
MPWVVFVWVEIEWLLVYRVGMFRLRVYSYLYFAVRILPCTIEISKIVSCVPCRLSLGITFDRTKESGGGCSLRLLCDEPRRRGLVVGDLALLCER